MPRWSPLESLRAQIVVISAASISVLGLTAFLVYDALTQTERTLEYEARQQCLTASHELNREFQDWIVYSADSPRDLPPTARDLSLRALSATVLRAYEGVEGGFFLPESGLVAGYANPTRQGAGAPGLTASETEWIRRLTRAASLKREPVIETRASGRDLLVAAVAGAGAGSPAAWTMKRIAGVRDPVGEQRRAWLAALVFSALLGVLGIVSIWYSLRRGVAGVKGGLRRLEEDFTFRLPAIPADFGEIAHAINQMADRRAELEEELRRQDRLAALGKVVAGVAHEIRNPLNSIRLTLELLNRRVQRGAAQPHEVEAAVREIDRLDLILTRLLAFGQPALENRHPQSLAPIVERAVRMIREQCIRKQVRVQMPEFSTGGWQADVDGPQIEQVLINLLLNAVEATPAGGLVTVGVETAGGGMRISIQDGGTGIPEESKAHVFDAFYTTKPGGTGLGLSVSREIAVNHGGELKFESHGRGTRFQLELPVERGRK